MSALGETLGALSRVIDGLGLGWYVFGAQAVAVRGAPRATQDVDITVHVPSGTIPALVDALGAEGLVHRHPESARELLETAAVLPLSHPSGMEVDLIVAGSGLEQLALERSTRVLVEGVRVPVASASDLVVMKILAGRGKDLDDVEALIASDTVDESIVRDLLEQFEAVLERNDLVTAFDTARRNVPPRP